MYSKIFHSLKESKLVYFSAAAAAKLSLSEFIDGLDGFVFTIKTQCIESAWISETCPRPFHAL